LKEYCIKHPDHRASGLSLATHLGGVSAQPAGMSGTTLGLAELVSLSETTAALARGGKTTQFTMFHDWFGYPLDGWITSDCLVHRINHDDFKVLVG